MNIVKVLLIIFLLGSSVSYGQSAKKWFPDELNVQPFTANLLEARSGFAYMLGKSSLRLDIGITSDIFHSSNNNRLFSIGTDFFTYTRLHGNSEFHFPVETIDYFFGINAAYKVNNDENEYGVRFRLSHISAHLVDGSFDYTIYDWRDYRKPRVYSREFIEFIPFFRTEGLRVYTGITYLIHSSPEKFGKGIYQVGFDYYYQSLSDLFTPFAAYDFRIEKLDKYAGINRISAGLKFGQFDKKGFSILYSYISGKSIHGEYFDLNETYSTIGFNLDL